MIRLLGETENQGTTSSVPYKRHLCILKGENLRCLYADDQVDTWIFLVLVDDRQETVVLDACMVSVLAQRLEGGL